MMLSFVVQVWKNAFFLDSLLQKERKFFMLIEMNIMELKLLLLTWQIFGNNLDQELNHQKSMVTIETGMLIWSLNLSWLMEN